MSVFSCKLLVSEKRREEKKRKEKKREEKSRGDELQDGKASGLKGWATGWEDLIPEGVSYRRERL